MSIGRFDRGERSYRAGTDRILGPTPTDAPCPPEGAEGTPLPGLDRAVVNRDRPYNYFGRQFSHFTMTICMTKLPLSSTLPNFIQSSPITKPVCRDLPRCIVLRIPIFLTAFCHWNISQTAAPNLCLVGWPHQWSKFYVVYVGTNTRYLFQEQFNDEAPPLLGHRLQAANGHCNRRRPANSRSRSHIMVWCREV